MKNNMIVIIVVIALIVGAGGFFGGVKYQQAKTPSGRFGNFQAGRNGGESQPRGQGFRPVNGEIIAVDDKSITVKLQDGSSKIIILTDTTAINKLAEGSRDDLKMGEKIGVFGIENSDGSVTAQNIQFNQGLWSPARRE